ncbi:MAG: hypothetical protein ABL994_11540 [Verrucomicrobiales bacterium]
MPITSIRLAVWAPGRTPGRETTYPDRGSFSIDESDTGLAFFA